jgi:hypothetical protein
MDTRAAGVTATKHVSLPCVVSSNGSAAMSADHDLIESTILLCPVEETNIVCNWSIHHVPSANSARPQGQSRRCFSPKSRGWRALAIPSKPDT